jgi:hypothetical protein
MENIIVKNDIGRNIYKKASLFWVKLGDFG